MRELSNGAGGRDEGARVFVEKRVALEDGPLARLAEDGAQPYFDVTMSLNMSPPPVAMLVY